MMVIVTCNENFSILFQFWDFINFIVFITGAQYSLFNRFLYLITRLNFTRLINLCRKSFVQLLITKFDFPAGSIPNQAEVKKLRNETFLKDYFLQTFLHHYGSFTGGLERRKRFWTAFHCSGKKISFHYLLNMILYKLALTELFWEGEKFGYACQYATLCLLY